MDDRGLILTQLYRFRFQRCALGGSLRPLGIERSSLRWKLLKLCLDQPGRHLPLGYSGLDRCQLGVGVGDQPDEWLAFRRRRGPARRQFRGEGLEDSQPVPQGLDLLLATEQRSVAIRLPTDAPNAVGGEELSPQRGDASRESP